MSVTFQIASTEDDVIGWSLECVDNLLSDDEKGTFPYEQALEMLVAHNLTCAGGVCSDYGVDLNTVLVAEARADLSVNMSSSNAGLILGCLAIPAVSEDGEFGVGEADAADFLGRVKIAQGLMPRDAGRPARTLIAADRDDPTLSPLTRALVVGGATVTDMGRGEGYIDQRLVELAELAEAAIAAGRLITWA